MKKLLMMLVFMLPALSLFSQDFIYKKNREILKVKIEEVGTSEVKFKDFNNLEGPSYFLEKAKISKIELENGDVMTFKSQDNFTDPDYYTEDHRNVIKYSFTAPMWGYSLFSYERALSPTQAVEAGIGITGLGINYPIAQYYSPSTSDLPNVDAKGFSVRAGYKLKRSPDYYLDKMRYGHLLKGGYFKPEIIYSNYSRNYSQYDHISQSDVLVNKSVNSFAVMMNFGKQWIIDNRFALDVYFGVGYGTSDFEGDDLYQAGGTHYAFVGAWEYVPIAFTGGFSVGYVFGK